MRFIILLSVFTILFGFAPAQSVQFGMNQTMDLYKLNKLHEKGLNATLSAEDIEGSPYLNDAFVSGTVYTILQMRSKPLSKRIK